MAAKNSQANLRWTTEIPDEATKPAGPVESFKKAIERLGPFQHRLQDDADRLGPWQALHGRMAVSKELACDRVWLLARNYNRQTILDEGAPRNKDVLEALTKLETFTGELARFLASVDDITLQLLQTAGSGVARFSEFIKFPLMEDADTSGLPTPAGWGNQTESRWVKRLNALSQYANACGRMFLLAKGFDGNDLPDKGGNTNLYKTLYGSARWSLVQGGWHVYELFKPDTSTGTEGGHFHLFLLDVFEFATGLDPEEHSKLMPWVKHVVKVNRRMEALTQKELELIEEQCEIDSPDLKLSFAERQRRHSEVEQKMAAVIQEKYELWPELQPYSYPDRNKK
jgi:hypothetical protein